MNNHEIYSKPSLRPRARSLKTSALPINPAKLIKMYIPHRYLNTKINNSKFGPYEVNIANYYNLVILSCATDIFVDEHK